MPDSGVHTRRLRDASRRGRSPVPFLLSLWLLLSPLTPLVASGAARGAVAPSIAATKTDSFADPDADDMADPGQTVTYTVTLTNTGNMDATNVVFSDTVDANTTIVPGSAVPAAGVSGGTLTWNVGTLPASAFVTLTFDVVIDNPFTGAPPEVSNQGFVTADGGIFVLTGDPGALGSSGPTVTPVNVRDIFARDGKAPEPPTGAAPLLFTVALSSPAASAVTVDYATAAGGASPAAGGAACGGGVDYVDASGTVSFAAGEQLRTVSVNLCSDGASEPDETLLLNLSAPVGGTILDAQAVGTITATLPAGNLLISELRTFGPGSANDASDEFVELYNNTDAQVTVAASDTSAGWGVYTTSSGCDSAPLLLGTIPNGTVIPPRGHYLLVGTAYSLSLGAYATGDLNMSAGIADNANVAVFNTSDAANLSTVTRLDAVGFGGNTGGAVCDLLREGATAPAATLSLTSLGQHSFVRDSCGKGGSTSSPGGCPTGGALKDSHDNAADFFFVDANGTNAGAGQRLGAPGPENSASPLRRDAGIASLLLDASAAAAASPNRVRNLTSDPANNSTFGTLSIRRRFVNNTGANVAQLRFRIVDISTFPVPSGTADLRARTSAAVTGVPVNDAGTCSATGTPATAPCTVTVHGTLLETPPNQPSGGAFNSSMAAGVVTVGAPLSPGASVNLQFLLGLQQTGTFRFVIIIEALP